MSTRQRKDAEQDGEMEILYRVIQVVSSSLDIEEILSSLVTLVSEAAECDTCLVYVWDPDRERLILRAAPDRHAGLVGRVELGIGEGVAGWVAERRETVLLSRDAAGDARYKHLPEIDGQSFTAMLSVPIISRRQVLVGAINVHAPRAGHFTEEHVRFIEHAASLVAGSIENARLFESLADKERALGALVRKTILAQEEERRRVATEIHDGVTQQLVSIWYRVHACERLLRRSAIKPALSELGATKALIDETLADARSAVYALRPATLDDLGLAPTLRSLAERFQEESGVTTTLEAPDGLDRIPAYLETALYRITQESLNNIRKHAHATSVQIVFEVNGDAVVLRVVDDGIGFDAGGFERARPEMSFGLAGMRERVELVGGALRIDSCQGIGTQIEVSVPIDRILSEVAAL